MSKSVSCRHEPHWCRAGQETFRHRFLPLCATILSRRAGNPFTPKELSYDYHFPTFFPSFACKADKCRHTCCQKWEIDIDEDTARKYRHTPGPLGDELRTWMTTGDEGSACFRLNDQGYCHFLNEKGLCRLILEMGPSSLCQICRDHPRFYKFTYDSQREEDVTLAGTGLACEETVEQLLAEQGEMVLR